MATSYEIRRAYELRKYLTGDHHAPDPLPSPAHTSLFASYISSSSALGDSIGTVVELAATRLGVFAAFVALTDGQEQHLLAGYKGEISLEETSGDSMGWLGKTDVDKQSWLWLAQQVSATLKRTNADETPVYTLDRLDQNAHTSQLSSVIDAPHLRWYTAVPIVTSLGIDIGYLAVIDGGNHGGLNTAQINYLASLPRKCMKLLESAREKHLRERWLKMNGNLHDFLRNPSLHAEMLEEPPCFQSSGDQGEPGGANHQSPLESKERGRPRGYINPSLGAEAAKTQVQREKGMAKEGEEIERNLSAQAQDEGPATTGMDRRSKSPQKRETTYRRTFRRAAEFLRDALDVEGVLFLDGLIGFHGSLMPDAEPEQELETQLEQQPHKALGQAKPRSSVENTTSAPSDQHENYLQDSSKHVKRVYTSADFQKNVLTSRPGEILGLSHNPDKKPAFLQLSPTTKGLPELDEGYLQEFMEKHAHGMVWYFDKSGLCFSLQGDELVPETEHDELQRLQHSFPGARQIIFHTMTDPVTLKRLAGFFAWTTKDVPVFTDSADHRHIRDFLHMVEAELSRIDTMAAMKQQESFVASVSHELRTPLHGILGAAQFLKETDINSFQRGLIETIDSCGTTLHETLTSVLSYAKINQFERMRDKPRQSGPQESPWALAGKAVNPESERDFHGLYMGANIAALCEEVVSVVEASDSYIKTNGSRDLTVSMEAEYRDNWNFITEPGALRRIALNVIGNAVKYTAHGSVKVSLRTTDLKAEKGGPRSGSEHPTRLVIFACKDTGRGMGKTFVENHLFIPFSQEASVSSSGVGLGMSIVKSLVSLLGGEIQVSSEVNQGTEVQVRIPMMIGSSDPKTSQPSELRFEDDVRRLRQRELSVVVHGFPEEQASTLRSYLVDWFGCRILSVDEDSSVDITIVDEGEQEITGEFFKTAPKYGKRGVLLSVTHAKMTKPLIMTEGYNIWERVPRPLGPNNFSKALTTCMRKLDEFRKSGKASVEERKVEEVDETGKLEPIGDRQPDLWTQLPNDHDGPLPKPFIQPLSEEMTLETDGAVNVTNPIQSLSAQQGRACFKDKDENVDESSRPRKPRVLIVEDNAINLQLLKVLIQKRSLCRSLETAMNGQIAVDCVKNAEEGFDIVFMDISMPVMDGLEATRRIRALEKEGMRERAVIVALTGLASGKDEENAFQAGVDLFVTKPVQFNKLVVIFEEWGRGELRSEEEGVE
ncbi:hypothetical protein GQ43DRAFT_460273 [Delitschia confertaspora ATCC 74209]|uniref:histidine kinase n=1 Tax=Delitschia confertaspora ATCC 74209 TaxID=1513339 RepID=A0A9P4JVD8_9PLEO|nr:hypothetical protein GQ43DRAFT_460273 [Delitschia confertaspora ATCC 74209]